MKLYSTKNKNIQVSLDQAVQNGLAPDGGLYMPLSIPAMPSDFWNQISQMNLREISFSVAQKMMRRAVETKALKKIISETLDFDIPLVKITDRIYTLELFHGPTCAFKDVGARFMARLMSSFVQKSNTNVTILVATSGDTGSAVAQGFFDVAGIEVIILYPSGRISSLQEKQLTTLGHNITALEVDGVFDDCQKMVKNAFLDTELKKRYHLSSANSINIARLLPQSFYYFWTYALLKQIHLADQSLFISVPSGNFGNLTAGLIAKKMGLPVTRFIAATNVNDVVPRYLKSGVLKSRVSKQTISNSMDVGNPSNIERIQALYQGNVTQIRKDIIGMSFTDVQTTEAIREVKEHTGYLMDPHGAVGYLGLKNYLNTHDGVGVFLETAHPAKFAEVIEPIIREHIDLPPRLKMFLKKKKKSIRIDNSFHSLKEYLLTVNRNQ